MMIDLGILHPLFCVANSRLVEKALLEIGRALDPAIWRRLISSIRRLYRVWGDRSRAFSQLSHRCHLYGLTFDNPLGFHIQRTTNG